MSKLFFAAILVVAAASAVAAASQQHVLYTRTTVPSEWTMGAASSPESPVEFTIALTQRNLDILDKWFWEVSDPTHKNYQEFKTTDEITDLVSPKAEDSQKVFKWLYAAGVHHSSVKSFGYALDVNTKVKHAETLFSAKFFTFTHSKTGAKVDRVFGSYSVPTPVRGVIDMVTGISTFPIPHLRAIKTFSNDYGVVPQTLDSLYQITQTHRELYGKAKGKMADPATSVGVIEFQAENFAPADSDAFGTATNIHIQDVPADQTIGPNDPTNPQIEASLDIEMTQTTNLQASQWFWLENGNGWLYQYGVHFVGTADVPQVVSISYGWWEGDQCTIAPDECQQLGVDSTGYVNLVNIEFQKIGLKGTSLLSASGDSGANGRTDPDCSDPQLRPSFPASSPYITAVGATELTATTPLSNPPPVCASAGLTCVSGGAEQAVSYAISSFASGGGFSAIAAMPTYQTNAVNAYLNSGVALPPASYFNASGRAFPDIAAQGHNVVIVSAGAVQAVGGTSCSSPICAGIFSLLNVAQIEVTGKAFGFLNPFIYQMYAAEPTTFTDITIGDNKCTEQGCSPSCTGYLCATGWDPVTGLGTPNFANMLTYVKSGRAIAHKRK